MQVIIKELFENKRLCEACSARLDARQVVLPVITGSKVWILGRNLGRHEDEDGKPFAERAKGGAMLDSWLDMVGYSRSSFFIESTIACYTKEDRPPTLDELRACRFWLDKELELLRPVLVIALGNDAFHLMLKDSRPSVVNEHGKPMESGYEFGGSKVIVFPMFHPGHCMRKSRYKKETEESDLPKLKLLLDSILVGEVVNLGMKENVSRV